MDKDIGVRMSQQSQGMLQTYASQPQFTTFHQPVDVVTETYTYLHGSYRI